MSVKNNRYELKVQEVNYVPAGHEEALISYEGDNYITIRHMQKEVKTHVRRIDKDRYQVLKTGEVKEYNRMSKENKQNARRSALNRTFGELRGLIRTNFVSEGENGENSQLFITLTYAENMQDEKRLYSDFQNFIDALKYAYSEHKFLYIAVMEPQGRGAWHVHLLLRSMNQKWLWIDKERVSTIWKKGYTTTSRLKCDDVGSYFTAYFTGLVSETHYNDRSKNPDDDFEDWTSEEILKSEQLSVEMDELYRKMTGSERKTVEKGKRLDMYPKGMRFYRCSQNVKRPEKQEDYIVSVTENEEFEKQYEKSFEIKKVYVSGEFQGEIESLNKIYHGTYKRIKRGRYVTDE